MDDEIAIGIDLGTTNTCAAYYYNGKVEVLENEEGERITPSFVLYLEKNKILVGKLAKHSSKMKPQYGIYEIKRLMGKKYNEIESSLQYFSFNVENNFGDPIISMIHNENNIVKTTPVKVSSNILEKIKRDVESKLKCTVTKAVICVPAYFNVNQRKATLEAAEKAGFTVLKLFNEPTAAALSYYHQKDCKEGSYSLVYDLGGGTFDVAVLKRNIDNIEIVAVAGDSELGGKDFDSLILDYVWRELERKYNYKPENEIERKKSIRRLQNICEKAKIELSTLETTVMELSAFIENSSVEIALERKDFEDMVSELIKKTIDIVDICLRNSNIAKSEIKDVFLAGGSTRIPKIQKTLEDYFQGRTLNKFVNPDECVAEGAALQAAMLSVSPKQYIKTIKIVDVVPLSLGIEDAGDRMSFVIRRNTSIPVNQSQVYVNVYDQQSAISFNVYEGERVIAKKNRCLGTFILSNITPAPPRQSRIIFTLSIDHNGILIATAEEEFANNVKSLKIEYTRGNTSDKEIKNAIKDAEDCKEEDERFIAFADHKVYVIEYCEAVRYNLEKKGLVDKFKDIYEQCTEVQSETKQLTDVEALKQVMALMKKITGRCDSLVKNYSFEFMPDEVAHLADYLSNFRFK